MKLTCLCAVSTDGYLSCEGHSRAFFAASTPGLLEWRRSIRDRCDAIIVGAGTVVADNPGLDNSALSNLRVVVDTRGTLDPCLRIFAKDPHRTVLLVNRRASDSYAQMSHLNEQVRLQNLKTKRGTEEYSLHKTLRELSFASGLVEGGASLIRRCIKEELIDSLTLVQFPLSFGAAGTHRLAIDEIESRLNFQEKSIVDGCFPVIHFSRKAS